MIAAPSPSGAAAEAIVLRTLSDGAGAGSLSTIDSAASVRMATIPVPPRVEGGWRGTAYTTLLLSVEVLVALVRGLFHRVGRGLSARRAAGAAAARGPRDFLRGFVRLLAFVIGLAILGGVLTLIVVLVGTRGRP